MSLSLYTKKRDLTKSREPKGKLSHKDDHLFVIQKHAASHLHYDFRLEMHGVLLSWAIPKGPSLDPSVKRLAVHVEDHPVKYGHFEGTIPKGHYGAGKVEIWDEGKWIPEDKNPEAAYKKGHLHFRLDAKKLHGRWNLIRPRKNDDKSWLLIKENDEYSVSQRKYDIVEREPDSVYSRKSKQKKVKHSAKFPEKIHPELATLVGELPDSKEWLHEVKLDGYRILAFKKGKSIKLMSRNNRDWTQYFPNIVKEIKKIIKKDAILDGEIVLLDKKGHSNFQELQNAIGSKQHDHPFVYYVFDLLYHDKENIMTLPLIERKKILESIISKNPSIRYHDHIIGRGNNLLKKACKLGLEGIVSKDINSLYTQKRTMDWLKGKCIKRQEFVIGGYTQPKGSRDKFGALYIGYYNDDGKLMYAGKVGTGFNRQLLKQIHAKLDRLTVNKNPFNSKPPGITSAIWVKPSLVAEVEFSEWTQDGSLRHPRFVALRTDKPAKNINREVESTVSTSNITPKVKLSHPDKLLYPEAKITKADLAQYYSQVQKWILPHLSNRPLTLLRCPDNYKKCFFQKHMNSASQGIYNIAIKEKLKTEDYPYIQDFTGLMSLVQMSVLEIHTWECSIKDVEHPNVIIFDIDPDTNIPWKRVVAAAIRIKDHLTKLKLKSFVKTTGGKGLHVVVPIKPELPWGEIKKFTRAFVDILVEQYPEEYVSTISKLKRKNKIFIDYLRNQKGATAVCPYSTRTNKAATVSVPLRWDELTNNKKDVTFTVKTLPKRLKSLHSDPWKEYFKVKQSIKVK